MVAGMQIEYFDFNIHTYLVKTTFCLVCDARATLSPGGKQREEAT